MREALGEPGPQAGHGGAVGELPGDLPADSALHVGVHVGEQEADRFQHAVEPAAEGQWRPAVGLLAGEGGGESFPTRAQRAIAGSSRGTWRGEAELDALVHRYLAYGGWDKRGPVLRSVSHQVFLVREPTRTSTGTRSVIRT
ncbi:hypothetical protein GCM10019016_071730 [Streptomyces prasinosporus]|uniref:Aldehyde ferredoxin oxidoreductase C-terminal domain-containing protein n=1 Tax=Streptomyces prasinosporus TaxID=68256 RepID=A0ABP6U070_9ACTN